MASLPRRIRTRDGHLGKAIEAHARFAESVAFQVKMKMMMMEMLMEMMMIDTIEVRGPTMLRKGSSTADSATERKHGNACTEVAATQGTRKVEPRLGHSTRL